MGGSMGVGQGGCGGGGGGGSEGLPMASAQTLPPPCLLPALQEFIDYFFLQRAATGASEGVANWRLHAQARGCCRRC